MKRVVSILLVAVMLLSVSAFALEERVQPMMIDLSFNGTTATCEVSAYASNMNQEVSAVIKLYHGKPACTPGMSPIMGTSSFPIPGGSTADTPTS